MSLTSKKSGINRYILRHLIIFVGVILGILWTFQILLLDNIYSAIVERNLTATANIIERKLGAPSLDEEAAYISHENDICTYVFKFDKKRATPVVTVHVSDVCLIHSFDSERLSELYALAKESDDGINIKRVPLSGFNMAHQAGNRDLSDASVPDSMICTKTVRFPDGSDGVIFLNCAMSPVEASVRTLREMLIWISLITLAATVTLALIMSRRISKPISDVNREAKALAHCTYDKSRVKFAYREIGELNDTLSYAASELSKVDRMQKELIANISHDLRTPLTLIEGYTEMMRDIPGENTPENMQVIIDETKRLSTLVSDLLEVSRLQTNSQPMTVTEFNITDAITETCERMKKLYEPEGYKINIVTDGDVYVSADRTRILQVIYNLIGNAVSYTGEDKTVTVEEKLIDGTVRISVTDTGAGIAEADLPYIWDRYYKVDKVHRRGAGGSGLGLSIVKEILLSHGSRFGVQSEVGRGSVFWFELCVSSPEKAADGSEPQL